MAKFDVTLPEISVETFEHAWLRFELAATAKEWQEDKQLRTLPTLLRGKLVEYFVELSSEEKSSLEGVKAALTKRASLKKDPLVAAKHFSSREQGEKESVRDYATQLRKAFAEAYPKEDTVSAVLLQKFMTGLRASITRQLPTPICNDLLCTLLDLSKCRFAQAKVQYLGHVVSAQGVEPDPATIQAVATYPVPRNVKELRQFLGLSNYYRRFVQDYSRIAGPLFKLTQKSVRQYNWNECCTEAFQELKRRLTNPPILAFPRFDCKFLLVSDSAIGAVLSQVQEGAEKVIAYWSRQLTKAERNYSTIEREALAIVKAVKEFYPYLYGHEFVLLTDHQPLTNKRR